MDLIFIDATIIFKLGCILCTFVLYSYFKLLANCLSMKNAVIIIGA